MKGMDPKDKQDCVIRKNVQVALATQLHEESVPFRREQKRYLEKLKENESKSKYVPTSSSACNFEDEGFGDVQMAMLEDSEFDAQAREKEIVHVAESIKDLQTIFKELAVLVIDQVRTCSNRAVRVPILHAHTLPLFCHFRCKAPADSESFALRMGRCTCRAQSLTGSTTTWKKPQSTQAKYVCPHPHNLPSPLSLPKKPRKTCPVCRQCVMGTRASLPICRVHRAGQVGA
jgi:hypothetical protein